jgi:thiamine-phosphate pyrophosphorylase
MLPSDAPQQTLPGLVVARSCHTLDDLHKTTAHFVTFGPVFDTPGKSEAVGLESLRAACQMGKSVYALGGVNWDNAAQCMNVGAEGIAGIRLFQEPDL